MCIFVVSSDLIFSLISLSEVLHPEWMPNILPIFSPSVMLSNIVSYITEGKEGEQNDGRKNKERKRKQNNSIPRIILS